MTVHAELLSRWLYGQQGFKCTQKLPPCRDFAIFMRVVVVGFLPSRCDLQAAEMSTTKEGKSRLFCIQICILHHSFGLSRGNTIAVHRCHIMHKPTSLTSLRHLCFADRLDLFIPRARSVMAQLCSLATVGPSSWCSLLS